MRHIKTSTLLLLLFIIVKFILQYSIVHPVYELHRDEFLHLDQAHHLAWGYASVPPVTSWISWLIFQLGNGVFWVKFFPALFGALTIWVVWKTTEKLGGKIFAMSLAATAILLSSLLRINMLYQPNSLEILCWTALFYTIIRFIQTKENKWLYYTAIIFAFGFLNKYNILFLLFGLVPALLLSPERKLFLNRHLYGAAILALAIVSPNLIWQWQNNFPVFRHLEELASTQLHLVNRTDFLIDQLFFFLGSILILIAGWIALLIYPPFKPFRFLLFSLLFTLIVFVWFKAKSYYAVGLYPIYFAFGSVYLDKILVSGWKRWLRILCFVFPLLLFIPMIELAFPLKNPDKLVLYAKDAGSFGEHRWEDGKKYPISQDFADMLGWKELTRKTDSISKTVSEPESTILLCDSYGHAGAINYYSKLERRAHSLSADYLTWLNNMLQKNNQDYKNVILVQEKENNNIEELRPFFDSIIVADSITTTWARERGARILVMQGAKISVRDFLQKLIAEENGSKATD